MIRIITAVGNQELNNILKTKENIIIESPDIQYQEGILEALEKYKNVEILIFNDELIGYMEIEDILRKIVLLNNNIKIIIITQNEGKYEINKNIIKIMNYSKNYIDDIIQCICKKQENVNKSEIEDIKPSFNKEIRNCEKTEETKKISDTKEQKVYKRENKLKNNKKIITVIGYNGVREDNIYFNLIKIIKKSKNSNN